MKSILCTIFFVSTITLSSAVFCDLKWPVCGLTVKNTVCERDEKCLPEPGCQDLDANPEFLKFILHEHNRLRNTIASGADTRGFTGVAANMMAMSYDKDLEYTARCHINRCKFEHDKCRGTAKFLLAGQNIYYTSASEEELKKSVTEWFEEINKMTPDVIDSFPRGRHDIGHFSQMIWAKTTHVGCALSKSISTDEEVNYYIACNYGPIGNLIGKPVYERGEGCSKCPDGVACNAEFPALCGEVDESQIYAKRSSGENISLLNVAASTNTTSDVTAAGITTTQKGAVTSSKQVPNFSYGVTSDAATKASDSGVAITVSDVHNGSTVAVIQNVTVSDAKPTNTTANVTQLQTQTVLTKVNKGTGYMNTTSPTFVLSVLLALLVIVK